MEKYREKKKDLHMVFIDLEKAYDSILRYIIWESLEKRESLRAILRLYETCMMEQQLAYRNPLGLQGPFQLE